MPVNQSLELQGAYEKASLEVDLDIVHGVAHGGEAFFAGEHLQRAVDFLRRVLNAR
jgi:hypothetical protein